MAFAAVQRSSECRRQLADESVVWETEVAQFEGESDEVSDAGILLAVCGRMDKGAGRTNPVHEYGHPRIRRDRCRDARCLRRWRTGSHRLVFVLAESSPQK